MRQFYAFFAFVLIPSLFSAQPVCWIDSVTATVVDCEQGQFFVVLDFYHAGTSDSFSVAGNGHQYGTFPYGNVPITLGPLPANGTTPYEFVVIDQTHDFCSNFVELGTVSCDTTHCEIFHLEVETECTNAGYEAWVNFEVQAPMQPYFDLWANGSLYGFYPLDSLPVHIPNFPTNPGPNDLVKVCINDNPNCCAILEFPVPDCDTTGCEISNMQVTATPCICGQFFALLSFDFSNVGQQGFDVMGNGHSYGTFSYDHTMPIVLGPLQGDNHTAYEFAVKDHLHNGCHRGIDLGVVDCGPMSSEDVVSVAEKLFCSPNPASDWVQIALKNASDMDNRTTLQIFGVAGKMVHFEEKNKVGSSFKIQVGHLPAGFYRAVVQNGKRSWQGEFVKQ